MANSIRRDNHQLTVQEAQNLSLGLSGAVTATATGGIYAGFYCAIQAISDTTFSNLGEIGIHCNGIKFDNGAEEISIGDLIGFDGLTHRATVLGIYNETGTWAGNNRAGLLHVSFDEDSPITTIAANTKIDILDKNTGAVKTADAAEVDSACVGDTGDDLNTETLKAGSVIYGLFTEVNITSGTARLYKA
jgi:hypothetical protein